MKEVAVVYPHQLYEAAQVLAHSRPVFIVEEPLILSHNPAHRARLILHKLSMDAYQSRLKENGYDVQRLTIADHPETHQVFDRLKAEGVERMHIADTHDSYLEEAIEKSGISRAWHESPQFLLSRQDAEDRYLGSKRFMASFYKSLRKDRAILTDTEGAPVGGKWSFDEDNRKKIPRGTALPADIKAEGGKHIQEAARWAESFEAERYGAATCWLPYTHTGALDYLQDFLDTRFRDFGPFEDAMTTRGTRLWHSTLSPLINIGLLTPRQVLDAALAHAARHDVPLNSLEGFVRQILGWREFIRASYEVDGGRMRTRNFWGHTRKLPQSFWSAETGIGPVDHTIRSALAHGYTHHIERLMVMGNIMLLLQVHPDEVYRWFMGLYIDAYDWVMVPNVYGMSQFADGGGFATKPYISGANYIRKMSDFESGDWEKLWTALYWNFINDHTDVFEANHRLSMMPRVLARMKDDTRRQHFELARHHLKQLPV